MDTGENAIKNTSATKKQLTVLFVGLGSIGTRHLKNLHAVADECAVKISAHALRSSKGDTKSAQDETQGLIAAQYTYDEIESLAHYDAIFITNPTSLHYSTMKQLKNKTDAWFIEKPIFDDETLDFNDCVLCGQKAYVAAPMRFCAPMIELKKRISGMDIYSVRVICSSYLPSWRPNVDYRTVYSAKKELGGGVEIDLIHEWDYIADLFGVPERVHAFIGKYSHLEIDSNDIAVYIAQYKDKLCEVHLDYFGREYTRRIELYCKEGTVCADFGKSTLTMPNGDTQDFAEPVNERYLREMRYFLQHIQSDEKESINTPQNAINVLKLTLAKGI